MSSCEFSSIKKDGRNNKPNKNEDKLYQHIESAYLSIGQISLGDESKDRSDDLFGNTDQYS